MPYSVRERNDKHRQDLANELVLLGVDPFTARQIAMRLPGGWAKKPGEELMAINQDLRFRTQTHRDHCASMAEDPSFSATTHESPEGQHAGRREDCGFCVDQAPARPETEQERCSRVATPPKKGER